MTKGSDGEWVVAKYWCEGVKGEGVSPHYWEVEVEAPAPVDAIMLCPQHDYDY